MIKTQDWIEYFPFKNIRPEQETAINFILNAFYTNNKRYVICELPPGIGKSAISITVSRYIQNKIKPEEINASWILTTQKILQSQYKRDFNWIPIVWSKTNYTCSNHVGISCQLGLWINNIFKKKYCDCVYTKDKNEFLEGQISLTNVPYFLNHIEYGRGEIKRRELLVIDECHNLENNILEFVSIDITKSFISKYKLKWIGYNKTIVEIAEWIEKNILPRLLKVKKALELKIKEFKKEEILNIPEGRALMKQFDELDNRICKFNRCIARFNENDWVMHVDENEEKISLKPIYASRYSHEQLFNIANKILLMSATILNKDYFCKSLGINNLNAEFISMPSPFNVENRKIYSLNIASLSYKNIDNSLPIIVETIKSILEKHKNDKGIIHCVSYKIANYINQHINNNGRLLIHDSYNREDIYKIHIKNDSPTVIVSPSFTEGIDLYDDLSRFQIIVKVPYPNLADKYTLEKMRKAKLWYEWETCKTIIQASGRSVRNENDYCVTYILDKDFDWFFKKNSKLFPEWYKESIEFI